MYSTPFARMLVNNNATEAEKLQRWLDYDGIEPIVDEKALNTKAFLDIGHGTNSCGVVKTGQIRALLPQFVRNSSQISYVVVFQESAQSQWLVMPFAPLAATVPATDDELRTDMDVLGVRVIQVWNKFELPAIVLSQSFQMGELSGTCMKMVENLYDHLEHEKSLCETVSQRLGAIIDDGYECIDPRFRYREKCREQFSPVRELAQIVRAWKVCSPKNSRMELNRLSAADNKPPETYLWRLSYRDKHYTFRLIYSYDRGLCDGTLCREDGTVAKDIEGLFVVVNMKQDLVAIEDGRCSFPMEFVRSGFCVVDDAFHEVGLKEV